MANSVSVISSQSNKKEMVNGLRMYAEVPDDDNIRVKMRVKEIMMSCPELLYAVHNPKLEGELFDKKTGKLLEDGDWSRYFGATANIRPFASIPETQTENLNVICYQTLFNNVVQTNKLQKYLKLTFTAMVHETDELDAATGIPRHDLISAILIKLFNWTDVLGVQTKLGLCTEGLTDNHYVFRTLTFEAVAMNGIYHSRDGKLRVAAMQNYD